MKGNLIVFEGVDGVGKTTLSKLLSEELNSLGYPTKWYSFPGNTDNSLGKIVYDLHHNKSKYGLESLNPTSLQVLHIAAHIDLIEQHILPQLKLGINIVLDRYWWSTWVYGRIFDIEHGKLEHLKELEKLCWMPYSPSVVVLVGNTTPYRQEMNIVNWIKLKELYDDLATKEIEMGQKVLIFSNSEDLNLSKAKLLKDLKSYLNF